MSDTQPLYQRYYYSKPDFLGGTRTLFKICREFAGDNNNSILEIGPGPTSETTKFLTGLGRVSGLDITDECFQNQHLSDAKVFDGRLFPLPDNSYDLCVSDWVLEHLEFPAEHMQEVSRVLKPGGIYCFRTMNLWHYVSIASRLLPHSMHLLIANRIRGMAKDSHPPYPTYYRANTLDTLKTLASQAGLQVDHLSQLEPEPSYGRAHPLLFYPMMGYERLVNAVPALSRFRITIYGVLRKPPQSAN